MPLYQMFCITKHYPEYKHIRELIRQSATHVMNAGGVVRKIDSWGTRTLPQRMKRQGPYANVGESFPLQPEILEVVNKTLAFHTSVNYQIQAPPPYDNDVHEDLVGDLRRISDTDYLSEFDFHLDMYRSFKRVNDGHCGVYSRCYDSLYVTYLPIPLVLLEDGFGSQAVHIAPEAYTLAAAEFGDSLWFWEASLPRPLTGGLASLSGRKVLLIDGQDPFVAVDANADITGSYQSHATRQNSFFSSYRRGPDSWEYNLGNFAAHPHPLTDEVELTIEYPVQGQNVTVMLPYRSRFGSSSNNFTDSKTLRENNCIATLNTNGLDLYGVPPDQLVDYLGEPKPLAIYQQQPILSPVDYRERHPVNVFLDGSPLIKIDLSETLAPSLEPSNSSYSVAEFFMLKDNITGVLALDLKRAGAEQLIVDVTNNGGGYICIAHWLHRIIIGPKDTTVPQAGLDTTTRAGPLAQLIAKNIAVGHDPDGLLLYNPTQWTNASNQPMPTDGSWLQPRPLVINGRADAFSQRLGQECYPFKWQAPKRGLFQPEKIVIMSNGRYDRLSQI
ncbi:hypothetical protein MD484_g7281, partial [Candolleomyces efflorescens]